ncbi:MAG TPA: hypothetical protein VHB70_05920 [Parafilimonas sp.]|nr:hypothetical protein [Parafilimonas sp.]
MPKKIILLSLFIIFYTIIHAQDAGFMKGTWKSTSGATKVSGNIINTIQIDDVSGESFTGTKTSEINDNSQAKITISISGFFSGKDLYLQNGAVVNKEPANRQWDDCSACTQENKMTISRDSLILRNNISGCNNRCDGETFYYRLLSDYDSATQRHLLDRFGRPSDIIGFRPFHPQENETVASKEDSIAEAINQAEKNHQDSLDNIARIRQQQLDESNRLAQQKKRQQEITDSLNLVKREPHIQDSLDNVARIRQKQIDDSTQLAQQKKRQQEITDSLNLVQQREQQHIKDSMDNVARIRQQQIDDSTQLAQQKKRDQEIADSLNLVQEREQQRIKDSLDNVARLEQMRKRTADSLLEMQTMKRQQKIADSLAVARKQQYDDSLQKAATAKASQKPAINSASSDAKELTSRTSVLLGTYHITSPDILIELFDNGEIDGDRVSVYHNNAIIVSNQTLGTKAITLNIHADTANREHEFVLVAENLGSIPPNSALMRITAGKQVYKLTVNTDMKTNARIVFYYDGN